MAGSRARARERLILGLETSCDETAAALVTHDGELLANVVSSQAELHAKYGGVVPEVASRRHLELVTPVVREALDEARRRRSIDVEQVAVTQGPGLIGALLVGLSAAKALAWALRLPLAPVDHLHGHVASLFLKPEAVEPAVPVPARERRAHAARSTSGTTAASGLGTTLDDAAGEAFDKGARLLGLGYPGGAAIDRLAREGDPEAYAFPVARVPGLDFSFSGLKTALLYKVRELDAGRARAAPGRPRGLVPARDRHARSSSGPRPRPSRPEPIGSPSSAASPRTPSCGLRSRGPRSRRSSSARTTPR